MKSAERCAWLAAAKIARLSAVSTSSLLAIYRRRGPHAAQASDQDRHRGTRGRARPRVLRSRSLRTRNVWYRSRAPGAIRVRSNASSRAQGRNSSRRRGRSRRAAARCCLSRAGKRVGCRRGRALPRSRRTSVPRGFAGVGRARRRSARHLISRFRDLRSSRTASTVLCPPLPNL
jgi:hypothetical protein